MKKFGDQDLNRGKELRKKMISTLKGNLFSNDIYESFVKEL